MKSSDIHTDHFQFEAQEKATAKYNQNAESSSKPAAFTRYIAVDLEGNRFDIAPGTFRTCPLFSKPEYAMLSQFVANELSPSKDGGGAPKHIDYMQQVRFTYKQSPLKVYEEATCFRNEQEGEVSGLKRVRHFMMTDMHAACASVEEARGEFETLCLKFADLMNQLIARDRWVLGWEGTVDFYEQNRDWLIEIGTSMGVPAFFKLMPEMSHYYAIKNEYQFITEDRANIQVSTVQWDVKDGERFNIGFIDDDLKHPCPVIIHASSFGSIERTLCAILENIAVDVGQGRAPMFPLWLSPTQVRVLPVNRDSLAFAQDLASQITSQNIRVDVDDRDDTVGKKVRNGEKEWIPYLLVGGEREQQLGKLQVRSRAAGNQVEMTVQELIEAVKKKGNGMPFRTLPLPVRLSQRPIFFG